MVEPDAARDVACGGRGWRCWNRRSCCGEEEEGAAEAVDAASEVDDGEGVAATAMGENGSATAAEDDGEGDPATMKHIEGADAAEEGDDERRRCGCRG